MEDDQFNEDFYVHQMNQGPIPNMPIFVPIYLNKKELYESLTGILSMKLSALIYNNNVLEYDDSSIDDIEEGGDLFILYKGESYVDYLNKEYEPTSKI